MMRLKQLALWLAPWRSVLLASNVGVSGQDWGRNGRAERSIMLPLCRGRWMGWNEIFAETLEELDFLIGKIAACCSI